MDRITKNRQSGPHFGPKLALLATAAVAAVTLTGCTTASAPRAEVSFNKAQKALEKGQYVKAIDYAEAAVLAEPRDAGYRALLGAAYLDAGRYKSAATSFGEAIELGDKDPRTVLSFALSKTAIGEGKDALAALTAAQGSISPADAGLALALAGDPERGVFVLTNALRAGQSSAKVRQNLAYTYALAGNWRAARVMAAEDVPADRLDARLSDWASKARPEDHMVRVSELLGVAPISDSGRPAQLALANFPTADEMLADAKTASPVDAAPAQVAAAPGTVSVPAKPTETKTETAAVTPKPVAKPVAKPSPAPRVAAKPAVPAGPSFVSRPVTQTLPAAPASTTIAAAPKAKAPTPAPAKKSVAKKAPKGDSHMVQLGSYVSEVEAKRGWTSLKAKFPQLAAHDVVITKAEVKGKVYYRVAAAGFGQQGAAQMCSTVKAAGRGCFAYAKTNPPKGAVGKGTRIAAAR
ncbi:MAG: SPOR domain-containing protein [Erythrobacter sp.]|uniref:SPOR domain-containing protein n=1 Tax=Erythrobacter sp. TaxID=1042 RepID=UPI00260463D0|nr:SPOR domain-containing protein [Erythrobacter sp.]MDJ0978919.1 SPOR domain-containing protein [Erythrobacter sp.]